MLGIILAAANAYPAMDHSIQTIRNLYQRTQAKFQLGWPGGIKSKAGTPNKSG
jgi:hypothetical protein